MLTSVRQIGARRSEHYRTDREHRRTLPSNEEFGGAEFPTFHFGVGFQVRKLFGMNFDQNPSFVGVLHPFVNGTELLLQLCSVRSKLWIHVKFSSEFRISLYICVQHSHIYQFRKGSWEYYLHSNNVDLKMSAKMHGNGKSAMELCTNLSSVSSCWSWDAQVQMIDVTKTALSAKGRMIGCYKGWSK